MSGQSRLADLIEDIGADVKALNTAIAARPVPVYGPAGTLTGPYPDGTIALEY